MILSQKFQLQEGTLAPDFTFKDSDNKYLKLTNFLGNRIIIYFYPNDFTPGCTTQASEFSNDYNKYLEHKITIIGISPNDQKTHYKFKEKMNIPFLLVSDANNQIAIKYGVYGLKQFNGKEYMGVNRTTFLIDKDRKIMKIFYKVKPRGHSSEVLNYFLTYNK